MKIKDTTVLIIVFCLAVITGLVWLRMKVDQVKNSSVKPKEITINIEKPKVVQQKAGLKVFNEWGYEIWLPEKWTIKYNQWGRPDCIALNSPENAAARGHDDELTICAGERIGKSFPTLEADVYTPVTNHNQKEIWLAGEPAYSYTVGGNSEYFEVSAKHKNKYYYLHFGYRATEDELNDSERLILSSFKYL